MDGKKQKKIYQEKVNIRIKKISALREGKMTVTYRNKFSASRVF